MTDKKTLADKVIPFALLQAVSREAAQAVPQGMLVDDLICIRQFPFKIGRESRVRVVNGKSERIERPKNSDLEPNNDLYLVDRGQLLNISREHLQIEKKDDGYVLVDRGSACGTKINGNTIGGEDKGGISPLHDGDVITVGTKDSPYRYRFMSLDGMELKI